MDDKNILWADFIKEAALYNDFLNKGADAVIDVLHNGLQKAMTVYNK